jgi:hypothetical protein
MTPIRWIYRFKTSGRVPAAAVTVDDQGQVWMAPEGPYFTKIMALIGDGVYSNVERRVIERTEGEAFISALEQMFHRSSTWIVDVVPPSEEI